MAGAVAGAGAWAWFAARPETPVYVGLRKTDWYAPALYQASAFPAFGAVVAQGVADLLEYGDSRRLLLAGLSSALGVMRLRGWLPGSGHAFFLGAVMGFESMARQRRSTAALAYALGGLAVTLPYKARWRDLGGAAMALCLGSLVGAALGPSAVCPSAVSPP